jgi:thiol-disulfide isomerase/thioredoxin
MKRRVWVGAGAAALLGGAGLAAWYRSGEPPLKLDESFWSLRFRSAAGGEVSLADFRGKPLLLNFWATWCAPCIREMPALSQFQTRFAAQGVQVLGLAVDQIAPVLLFSQKVKVNYPLLVAEGQGLLLSQRLGNPGGLPFTALFDARGQLVQRKAGETTLEELTGWVTGALQG